MEITPGQQTFLSAYGLSMDMLFDAQGTKPSVYGPRMRELNKFVAINTTPCARGGHTLRARNGNCIQCNTAQISYTLAPLTRKVVYAGFSSTLNAVKIGTVDSKPNLYKRILNLNHRTYGGAVDWVLLFAYVCPPPLAHNTEVALNKTFGSRRLKTDDTRVECREVFAEIPARIYQEMQFNVMVGCDHAEEIITANYEAFMFGV